LLDIVIRVVVNAVALIAAIYIVPGATFTGDWWRLLIVAAIFGLVNAYLRPIVKLLSLPLTLLVFGLVGLIINTGMVLLTAAISDNLKLGFTLAGWPPGKIDVDVIIAALLTSIVVAIVSALMAVVRMVTPRF
jgi:putative membrane protein